MRLPTLSFIIVMLPKVPIIGSSAITVRIILAEAVVQFLVLDCVAVISTLPPSNRETLFPTTVATAGFDDVNAHLPSEVEVGGVRINDLCRIEID